MRHLRILIAAAAFTLPSLPAAHASPTHQPLDTLSTPNVSTNISLALFAELEELSRLVDISYCVGTTGISKPFSCASRCDQFPGFELIDAFNTGPLMSDSCGYVAVDHGTRMGGVGGGIGRETGTGKGRIIVAFRGTYSIANTIVDLSTVPQEYVPYPDSPDNSTKADQPPPEQSHRRVRLLDWIPRPGFLRSKEVEAATEEPHPKPKPICHNCTVHSGFWTSWQNTRSLVVPQLEYLRLKYPSYMLHLVGHSLGGAVATLAGLEFEGLGWHPHITTFGEPRVGNAGLRDWIDETFALPPEHGDAAGNGGDGDLRAGRYRRVTHVDDPVPLLPLQEWGYRAHAGEVYISKASLQPALSDIRLCYGDEDVNCIAGAEVDESWFNAVVRESEKSFGMELEAQEYLARADEDHADANAAVLNKRWGIPIPARYKIWQLFFAHRDYFWRLGLCVPGGDPMDWGRERYEFGDGLGGRDGDEDQGQEEL